MFIALLGFALASEWRGEENFVVNVPEMEENGFWDWITSAAKWVWNNVLSKIFRGNFNEHEMLDQFEKQLGRTFQTRQFTRSKVDGGVWIRGHADELVLSAYMHPTKAHSVAIRSGATAKILPEKIEVAPAGAWAIAFGNPGSEHSEALYKVE